MIGLGQLTRRNCKLFFKDRGMFFSALISPLILLVLYATFLARVYRDSFLSELPEGFVMDPSIIDATVAGQLISSLLAVSCVTVAFCSNLLMVQDRISGARRDLTVSPVRSSTLAISYFLASLLATLIVNLTALAACMVYLLVADCWYLTLTNVLGLLADVILLTLFGVALSSCIHVFLSTSGQGSAVGTIISAGYGFICGAYMPISNFSEGLQNTLSLLPGTYGTALVRNHAMSGAFSEMTSAGFPLEVVEDIRRSLDCSPECFGHTVPIGGMYAILGGSVLLLLAVYVVIHKMRRGK